MKLIESFIQKKRAFFVQKKALLEKKTWSYTTSLIFAFLYAAFNF